MKVEANCGYCEKSFKIERGALNRATKSGLKVYCCRKHSGLGRRVHKSKKQMKQEKAEYDKVYRQINIDKITVRKQEWFKKDYAANPEKYKRFRQKKREYQREYCRKPDYKKYKKGYDEKHRAKVFYGEYAESFILINSIRKMVDNKVARFDKQTHNKTQKGKRLWKNLQQST